MCKCVIQNHSRSLSHFHVFEYTFTHLHIKIVLIIVRTGYISKMCKCVNVQMCKFESKNQKMLLHQAC